LKFRYWDLFRLAEYRPAHFSDECDKPACRQAGKQTFLVRQLADPEHRVSLSADKAGLLRGSLFRSIRAIRLIRLSRTC